MREVRIDPVSLERLGRFLDAERAGRLESNVVLARRILDGRVVWNVNATASGGGVAEMLTTLLAYSRGAGVDTRWLVLDGNPRFFRITKRLHNVLHGAPGDGGALGDAERDEYEAVLAGNLDTMKSRVRPGDIVLLHDPQAAGLAEGLRAAGAQVVWRCHIGRDTPTELTDVGWDFFEPYVGHADATIFSREAYGPRWVDRDARVSSRRRSTRSAPRTSMLASADVDARSATPVWWRRPEEQGSLVFARRDGSTGTMSAHATSSSPVTWCPGTRGSCSRSAVGTVSRTCPAC